MSTAAEPLLSLRRSRSGTVRAKICLSESIGDGHDSEFGDEDDEADPLQDPQQPELGHRGERRDVRLVAVARPDDLYRVG